MPRPLLPLALVALISSLEPAQVVDAEGEVETVEWIVRMNDQEIGREVATITVTGERRVVTSTGELVAFKPGGKDFVEVAKIKLTDAKTYAHPVIDSDKIYVKDEQTLTMMSVR